MALWRSLGRPQCGFHFFSPQRTPRGKHGKANRFTQKRTYAVPSPPVPRLLASLRPPSGSPQRNAQARSEPTKFDNRTTSENVLMAIPTHGGIETQHIASRLSFPDEGKETGVVERKTLQQERTAGVNRTQDTPTEPHGGREPNARPSNRTARQT